MARQLQKEINGKDENGRYSEEFKQKIIKCIEKGMNSIATAEELGIEPLGSGYRQLFYKLQREYSLGESIPTLKERGLKPKEGNKVDAPSKSGVDTPKNTTKEIPTARAKVSIADVKKLDVASPKKVISEEQKNKTAEKPKSRVTDKIKPIEESVEMPSKKGIKKLSEDAADKIKPIEKPVETASKKDNEVLPKSNHIINSLEEMIKVREKEIQELRQMISELKKEG